MVRPAAKTTTQKKETARGRERRHPGRRKPCKFCAERVGQVDYKDISRLQKFTSEHGKILPSRVSGNCAAHQRQLSRAIKRARHVALLPYVSE